MFLKCNRIGSEVISRMLKPRNSYWNPSQIIRVSQVVEMRVDGTLQILHVYPCLPISL